MLSDEVEEAPAPAPKPVAPPLEELKKPPSAFPDDPDHVEVVRSLGGSTGAELVRDEQGRLFVRKRGASPDHLREECFADAAYRALGVKVPEFKLYETPSGPVKLAKYIPDTRSLAEILRSGKTRTINATLRKLQQDLAADALLANWDVVGLDYDNILVDKKGVVWRIDNGGALRFRARGAQKAPGALDEWVTELWTMRDPARNAQAARVFGGVDWYDLAGQGRKLAFPRRRAALMEALPPELRDVMGKRLDTVADVAKVSKTFRDDRWAGEYVDGFMRHSVGLRRAGMLERLPKKLAFRSNSRANKVYDENGKEFDSLRGRNSVIEFLDRYMRQNGSDVNSVAHWMGEQARSSWSGASQAVKYHMALQREVPLDRYFWYNGEAKAKHYYELARKRVGAQKFDNSYQIWHAWNFEFVRNVDFTRNNRKKGFIELMRTESKPVAQGVWHAIPGQKGVFIRGGLESASIYRTVTVAGNELMLQRVPHHRIMGSYMFERTPGSRQCAFLGDRENEFVFLPEGIELYYYGTVRSGELHSKFWKTRW